MHNFQNFDDNIFFNVSLKSFQKEIKVQMMDLKFRNNDLNKVSIILIRLYSDLMSPLFLIKCTHVFIILFCHPKKISIKVFSFNIFIIIFL